MKMGGFYDRDCKGRVGYVALHQGLGCKSTYFIIVLIMQQVVELESEMRSMREQYSPSEFQRMRKSEFTC